MKTISRSENNAKRISRFNELEATVSSAQVRLLHARSWHYGWDSRELKLFCQAAYGVKKPDELTLSQFNDMINNIFPFYKFHAAMDLLDGKSE